MKKWEERLNRRKQQQLLRCLTTSKYCIDFASNDYLGLARSKQLQQAIQQEWSMMNETYCNGSTGSRLLTGNHGLYEEVEQEIAKFHGAEAGLLFNCGYMANLALCTSVIRPHDSVFYDAHIHASMHDGICLSRAKSYAWKHLDLNDLEKLFKQYGAATKKWVCVESIYSTTGDIAPLKEIIHLCHLYEAHLIVDEAHATGVYGPQGEGLAQDGITARVYTFGKALGIQGAVIVGSSILHDYLINFARPFIYTTSLPLYGLAAIKCAYACIAKANKERQQLLHIQNYFCQSVQKRHFPLKCTQTMIQPIQLKQPQQLMQECKQHGLDVRLLRYPTVERHQQMIRLCLHAFNTEQEIDLLLDLIGKCL